MNVLLLGSGGREHALAWKLAQSPRLGKLFAAPGNPGIAEHAEMVAIDPADHRAVVDFCLKHSVELVVIGPEAPLVDGLADNLRAMGFCVFGPNRPPAQLEGSKGFTKELCARHGIPTARYVRASDRLAAEAALDDFGPPLVIKADGLAAGKGVVIARPRGGSRGGARDHVRRQLRARRQARSSSRNSSKGEEASFFALTDGETDPSVRLRAGPQEGRRRRHRAEHRRDGRLQPRLGAHSGAGARAMDEIVRPTVEALAAQGTPYSGILYAGLMLTGEGPEADRV